MKKKTDFRRDAKMLAIDLECSPTLGWGYGQYETNLIKVEQPPVLLAVSWKWLGDKGKAQGKIITDYKQSDRYDDYGIVRKLWGLLDEAQIVYAHNGDRFDLKMANAFFIRHNMLPPSPVQSFDTLKTARKYFKFDNNKLDYLGKLLIGSGKTEVTYGECWDKLLHGSPKEQKKYGELMRKYCNGDVDILEEIYYKLLPWATNHPNLALYIGKDVVCPRCGNSADFSPKSYRRTKVGISGIQYQCKHCKAYVTRKLDKEERELLKEEGKYTSIYRNVV